MLARRRPLLLAPLAFALATSATPLTRAEAPSADASRPSATSALPNAGPVLSQGQALARLKRENLSLLAARYRLSQARAEVVAAGVWPNPNLSATGLLLTHGAVSGGRQEVTVSVDQVIPVAGQVGLRQDVARGYLDAEERAYAASAWQLVEDAKAAYLDLQQAQARYRVLRAGLSDLARVEGIVAERTAAGASAAYDELRVAVERSKLDGRLTQAEADLLAARAALAQAIGKSVDARTVVVDDTIEEPPNAPRDVAALVRRAVGNRPIVGHARARASASELRVDYLRRRVVPSPDVKVGYGRYINVPGATPPSGGALLLGLSFPLPILDHGQGTVDRGVAEAAEARAQKDEVELSVARQVERAAATMAVRVATWRRFRDTTAKQIDRLRETAELAYREGRASILELLDAYGSYVAAEERRVDLHAAAVGSALDLERAVGPRS